MKILLSVIFIIIVLICFLLKNRLIKEYYNKNRYAICFLAVKPNEKLYNFISELESQDIDQNYDFYLCIDKPISQEDYRYINNKKVNIIDIPNNICEQDGFKGSVLYFLENACSRDKALYYFSRKNKKYTNVWFIEEDVFFYDLNSIKNIDQKYDNSVDLISKSHILKMTINPLDWWWPKIVNKVKLPWAKSMICVVRVSNKLLESIDKFVSQNRTLFLDEALFNTIALQNNLNVKTPIEFSTIYENEWAKNVYYNWNEKYMNEQTLNTSYFLHPVKDINLQEEYRKKILNKTI
jgi:hypothetical protein